MLVLSPMSHTLVSLWTQARGRLEAAGVDTPVLDARLLLEAGAGVARLDIVTDPHRELGDEQVARVDALVRRREAREPISQILGRKAFWTLDLTVDCNVLSPRPETELVVATALELLAPGAPARVLDLGVGSGAILFAVLTERPAASGVGVDISDAALEVAGGNAVRLGLGARADLRRTSWEHDHGEAFDLVVANPPYIPSAEIDSLAPEVARYEPRLALDGGPDGLDAYRVIAAALPALVKRGGAFVVEVGPGQARAVGVLFAAATVFAEAGVRRDIAGVERVVWGRRAA